MNHDLGIVEDTDKDGFRVVVIDTLRALYNDTPWTSLGEYGKRKFENLVKLQKPGGVRIIYQ